MSAKHTPGPWHRNIKPARKYPIVFAGRSTHVAQVCSVSNDEETEANCNLIAAAPELLEALRECERFFTHDPNLARDGWMNDALRAVHAAIAKVEGTP